MGWLATAAWGMVGGLAAGLMSLMAAVSAAKYRWPWQHSDEEFLPRLFVFCGSVVLGALIAAAAHGQISGPWPAFSMGVGAPSVVRGMLSHIEVTESKPQRHERR
jgi:hypothetical protein